MSANPEELLRNSLQLPEEVARPFPGSRKVYVTGSRPDLRVGMREVAQTPTPSEVGAVPNPPVTVYDTAGSYTDPAVEIDLRQGLAPVS